MQADGLAWSRRMRGNTNQVETFGFVECNAAERLDRLKHIMEEHGLKGSACNLVLSPNQYQIFQVEKPTVPDEELTDAVKWKLKDMIDYAVDDAVVDVFAYPKDATRGRGNLVNVVCTRKAVALDQINLVLEAGLELESIDITELAVRNIAQTKDPDAKGVAILILRPGLGMMTLFKGDVLYFSRRIDFSVNDMNEPGRQDEVIQLLALEVQRSLDYYESQLGQMPPKELHLLNPVPELPVGVMLGGYLGVQVSEIDAAELSQTSPESTVLSQSFVALGAAMRREGL